MNTIKTILVVALVAALGALGVASAAGVAGATVTITGQNGDYHGRVESKSRYCERNRNVTVYKLAGKKPKPSQDKRVGSDSTDNGSKWDVGNTGYKHGKFYARASRTEVARAAGRNAPSACAAATSEVIKR